MRVPNFSDSLCITLLLLFFLHLPTEQSAQADVGGGKGYPATPWRIEGPKSITELEEAKSIAATYQKLSFFLAAEAGEGPRDTLAFDHVGLVPQPIHDEEHQLYSLNGTTRANELVRLSFSQIESFTVSEKDDETITLSATIWPEISAEELLHNQPSYQELSTGYRRDVVLKMKLKVDDGRSLVFAGKWGNKTLPLDQMKVGDHASFYEGHPHMAHPLRFWWAIPSVAKDPTYPFRMIPLL